MQKQKLEEKGKHLLDTKNVIRFSRKMGIKIGKIYREIVSGETIEARPEIQKLLSDVKKVCGKVYLLLK